LRALKAESKLQILSRPQVMTLENQPAFVVVGQEIRLPAGISATQTSTLQDVDTRNVGIVLGVTPRTTPDGVVVMEIDAERSSLGNEADGTTIGFSDTGEAIRVPPINLTTTQTTVRARTGQTVVLAGLISKQKTLVENGIPLLKNLPLVGWMFRFNSDTEQRSELLIIMTPYIVYTETDADWLKQIETERMNWSLEQVVEMHGDIGIGPGSRGDSTVPLIYPDLDPTGTESLPPAGGATQPMPAELPPGAVPGAGYYAPQGTPGTLTPPMPALPQPQAEENSLRSSRRPDAPQQMPAAAAAWQTTPWQTPNSQFQPQQFQPQQSAPLSGGAYDTAPAGYWQPDAPQGGAAWQSSRPAPWTPPLRAPRPLPPADE
jgi:hypothetical protein